MENFEKAMAFTLELPNEIEFGQEDPNCSIISGNVNQVYTACGANRELKTLTFASALQFVTENPGQLVITIDSLKNPSERIETSSFKIRTDTSDGYPMDEISENVTIKFSCDFPCATCQQNQPSTCESCYFTSANRLLYEKQCLSECPEFFISTEDLTCIEDPSLNDQDDRGK